MYFSMFIPYKILSGKFNMTKQWIIVYNFLFNLDKTFALMVMVNSAEY